MPKSFFENFVESLNKEAEGEFVMDAYSIRDFLIFYNEDDHVDTTDASLDEMYEALRREHKHRQKVYSEDTDRSK